MKAYLLTLILCATTTLLWADTFKVVEVEGSVLYRAPKKFQSTPVKLNDELEPGGRIKMKADGKLLLTTPKKDEIRLTGETYMKLEALTTSKKGESVVELQLFKGLNRNKVHKLNGDEAFLVRTPVAVVGVRGTDFECFVDQSGDTQVSVLEGLVEIQDIDETSEPINVPNGKSASVKSDGQIQVKSVQNIEKQMQENQKNPSKVRVDGPRTEGGPERPDGPQLPTNPRPEPPEIPDLNDEVIKNDRDVLMETTDLDIPGRTGDPEHPSTNDFSGSSDINVDVEGITQ